MYAVQVFPRSLWRRRWICEVIAQKKCHQALLVVDWRLGWRNVGAGRKRTDGSCLTSVKAGGKQGRRVEVCPFLLLLFFFHLQNRRFHVIWIIPEWPPLDWTGGVTRLGLYSCRPRPAPRASFSNPIQSRTLTAVHGIVALPFVHVRWVKHDWLTAWVWVSCLDKWLCVVLLLLPNLLLGR